MENTPTARPLLSPDCRLRDRSFEAMLIQRRLHPRETEMIIVPRQGEPNRHYQIPPITTFLYHLN
ncbi:hypothetical protein [Telluribacter humicola]|uniref:hypothetical protein n=1 Tax=Telluribacter humicola TaxID=1720261 RepID=UPI001A96E405|nr:hypothetical protein [Telluribacter humicola]